MYPLFQLLRNLRLMPDKVVVVRAADWSKPYPLDAP